MKVSILMAVYNGENYLQEALGSVLKQTHPDIELVVCNDGSTDSTGAILGRFKDKKNCTILHEKHGGKVSAFNKAFAASTGDAICFLAHDDVLPPDSIRRRASFLESTTGAVYCNGCICDAGLKPIRKMIKKPVPFTWERDTPGICKNNFLAGALLLIRRDIAERVFPIPESLTMSEDWWVVFNTLYHASRIERLDEELFLYRLHDKNDTGMPPFKDFDAYMLNHWKTHPIYYDSLRKQLDLFEIKKAKKEKLAEIIRLNKHLICNTLAGKYTLPSVKLLRAAGIPKYLCSQLTISRKAYLLYPVFTMLEKIR